jgi:hypothetical protein
MVAVLVCRIVVVTIVVEVPVPSVYVRTIDSSDPESAPVEAGLLGPLCEEGAVTSGALVVVEEPAAVFIAVAEYEE